MGKSGLKGGEDGGKEPGGRDTYEDDAFHAGQENVGVELVCGMFMIFG